MARPWQLPWCTPASAWPWARAGGCHLSGKCHCQAKLLSVLYWPGSAALRGTAAEQSWELRPAPVLYFQEMNWDSSDLTPRVSVSLNSPLAKWVAVKLGNLLACPTPSVCFFSLHCHLIKYKDSPVAMGAFSACMALSGALPGAGAGAPP